MRLWQGRYACALVVALFALFALPGVSAAAEPAFDKDKVPTVGGAEINVEVMRPANNRAGDPHLLALQHPGRSQTTRAPRTP
jgi:hypothetical protein